MKTIDHDNEDVVEISLAENIIRGVIILAIVLAVFAVAKL